ncbi:flippase [Salinigranum salinum]|uniref:flippase n=1 Tax=Salinigranum salinum TaxID=1364937 RepID=UPI001260EA8E|nr:flippase [Salinigranum salinum]
MRQNITNLVSIAFVGGMVGKGLRYGINVVVARGLGAEALGLFAFGTVLMKAVSVVSQLGLDRAAQKYIPIYVADDRPALVSGTVVICLGVPFVLGTVVAALLHSQWHVLDGVLQSGFGSTAKLFLVGVPLFSAMMVGATATRGFKETKYYVYVRDVGQSVVAFVLVAVGAFVLADVETVVAGYLVSIVVGVVLAVYYLARQGALSLDVRPSLPYREVLGFALPLTVAAVTLYLITWTDILMLGVFTTPAEVGWYQAAYQTSVLLAVVLQATYSIFPALASELYHSGRHDRLGRVYTAVTKWVATLTLFGFAFLFVFLDEILGLFGTAIPAAKSALLVLALGQVTAAVVGPAGYLLTMSEYERLQMVNSVVVSVANVGLNYVLIQAYGIVGAAAATGVSFVVLNALRLVQTWYLLNLQPYSRGYWRGLVAVCGAVPAMLLGRTLPLPGVVRVVVTGVAATAVFGAIVWRLGLTDQDYLLLESLE